MDLPENPFYILHGLPDMEFPKLSRLAAGFSGPEEKLAQEALANLRNPQKRLDAELGWLYAPAPVALQPGQQGAGSLPAGVSEPRLTPLSSCNLAIWQISTQDVLPASEFADKIRILAENFGNVRPSALFKNLEDLRKTAAFLPIKSQEDVALALGRRLKYFISALEAALDLFPAEEIPGIMEATIKAATRDGRRRCPVLLTRLAARYELHCLGFIKGENANVNQILAALDAAEAASEREKLLAWLEASLANWSRVCGPLAISCLSRGLTWQPGLGLGLKLYNYALGLYPQRRPESKRIMQLAQGVCAHIPSIRQLCAPYA